MEIKRSPGPTILLVEDESLTALQETALLEKHGFRIISVRNAQKALEAVRTTAIDLILMDIDLGEGSLDGTALAQIILKEREIPIVFLSCHTDMEMVEKVKDVTRYGFVLKSTGEFILVESINRAFDLFETHRRLKEQELEVRAVLDNIADALLRFNEEGEFIYFSPGAEKMFGFKADEVLGRKGTETINPPIDSRGLDQNRMLADIISDPEKYAYNENENIRKDGTRLIVAWHNSAVRDEYGRFLYIQSIGRDITEQKHLEQEHLESEERYRQIFENSPISLWVEDFSGIRNRLRLFEGKAGFSLETFLEEHPGEVKKLSALVNISDVNQTTMKLLGAETKEQVPANLDRLFIDQSLVTFEEEIKTLYRGEKFRGEIIGITIDGTPLDCIVDVSIVPGYEDSWSKVLVSISDISDLKRMERQKDFLMHELNHRIKNNLAIICSFIELKNSTLGPSVDLSDIRNQVDAIRIIHDKLYRSDDISHIDFKAYAEELIDTIFASFSREPVRVDLAIDQVSLTTKTVVPLGLIINEIATNALKHGFTETPNPEFHVSLAEDKEHSLFVLTLSNNGRAFPAHINLDNPDTLGMRIISALVQQLDGTLQLKKKPHPEFTICFTPEDR